MKYLSSPGTHILALSYIGWWWEEGCLAIFQIELRSRRQVPYFQARFLVLTRTKSVDSKKSYPTLVSVPHSWVITTLF